jgi:hypothetical protein
MEGVDCKRKQKRLADATHVTWTDTIYLESYNFISKIYQHFVFILIKNGNVNTHIENHHLILAFFLITETLPLVNKVIKQVYESLE